MIVSIKIDINLIDPSAWAAEDESYRSRRAEFGAIFP